MTTEQRKDVEQKILDYMEDNFNGDLAEVTHLGFNKVSEEGWLSGPLWDQIGMRVLRQLFYDKRYYPNQTQTIRGSNKEENIEIINEYDWPIIRKVGDRQIDIRNMTKDDLYQLSAQYRDRAEGFAFEADWFDLIAEGLGGSKQVKEVYTLEELRGLRKEVNKEELLQVG